MGPLNYAAFRRLRVNRGTGRSGGRRRTEPGETGGPAPPRQERGKGRSARSNRADCGESGAVRHAHVLALTAGLERGEKHADQQTAALH